MPLHTGRLLLAPLDPTQAPAMAPLRTALTEAGVLGGPLRLPSSSAGDQSASWGFAPGERFFEYLAFTGCAVRLDDLPAAGGTLGCHLRLGPSSAGPKFLHGRNTRPPRCRDCRATLKDWRTPMRGWQWPERAQLPCPACAASALAWLWDWRGQAGFARLTLAIEEVFPGEAAPLPALPKLLAQASDGLPWHWFMVQDEAAESPC